MERTKNWTPNLGLQSKGLTWLPTTKLPTWMVLDSESRNDGLSDNVYSRRLSNLQIESSLDLFRV
jgi:hypothetical protein